MLDSSSLLLILRLMVVAERHRHSTPAENTSGVSGIGNYQGLHVLYNDHVGRAANGINLGRLVPSTAFSAIERVTQNFEQGRFIRWIFLFHRDNFFSALLGLELFVDLKEASPEGLPVILILVFLVGFQNIAEVKLRELSNLATSMAIKDSEEGKSFVF
jgi:hypothetical protein